MKNSSLKTFLQTKSQAGKCWTIHCLDKEEKTKSSQIIFLDFGSTQRKRAFRLTAISNQLLIRLRRSTRVLLLLLWLLLSTSLLRILSHSQDTCLALRELRVNCLSGTKMLQMISLWFPKFASFRQILAFCHPHTHTHTHTRTPLFPYRLMIFCDQKQTTKKPSQSNVDAPNHLVGRMCRINQWRLWSINRLIKTSSFVDNRRSACVQQKSFYLLWSSLDVNCRSYHHTNASDVNPLCALMSAGQLKATARVVKASNGRQMRYNNVWPQCLE